MATHRVRAHSTTATWFERSLAICVACRVFVTGRHNSCERAGVMIVLHLGERNLLQITCCFALMSYHFLVIVATLLCDSLMHVSAL